MTCNAMMVIRNTTSFSDSLDEANTIVHAAMALQSISGEVDAGAIVKQISGE